MPDLLAPLCPAAQALAGPPLGGPSIICGVLRREGALQDRITEGTGQEHLTLQGDPSTVLGMCCGTAIPAATEADAKGAARAHYTFCPIWQQEVERIQAERRRAWGEPASRELAPIETADDLIASLTR